MPNTSHIFSEISPASSTDNDTFTDDYYFGKSDELLKRIYDLNDKSSALAVEVNGVRYVTDISNTTFETSNICQSGYILRDISVCGKLTRGRVVS